jgi:hypothetical protein
VEAAGDEPEGHHHDDEDGPVDQRRSHGGPDRFPVHGSKGVHGADGPHHGGEAVRDEDRVAVADAVERHDGRCDRDDGDDDHRSHAERHRRRGSQPQRPQRTANDQSLEGDRDPGSRGGGRPPR